MKLKRARLLLVPASIAGALVMLSLKCSEAPTNNADGGADAQPDRLLHPPDHNYDYTDAADVDAGSCSPPPSSDGLVHDWPGYRRLTEVDPCCPFDMLEDLGNATPYKWVACPTDAGGCLRFDMPTNDTNSGAGIAATIVRDELGSGKYLWLDRGGLLPVDDFEQTVYDMSSGRVIAAWRAGDSFACRAASAPAPSSDHTLIVEPFFANGFGHPLNFVVGKGTTGGLWEAGSVQGVVLNASRLWTDARYSSTQQLALSFQPDSPAIVTCDLARDAGFNSACVSANLASVSPATLLLDFSEGDTLFAQSIYGTTGWQQEYVIDSKGNVALLRGRSNAHVGSMRTDGTNLIWLETQGSVNFNDPQTISEVWSAPLTGDPSMLAAKAKKVATLPVAGPPGNAVAYNGYYLIYARPNQYVVRLSDGAILNSPVVPNPYTPYGFVYVSATEVWLFGRGPLSNDLFRMTLPPWP